MKGFLVLLLVALAIAGPLLVIWSLNTLFATGIEYTLATWFAALVLSGAVAGSVGSGS
jgi:hypothetical protein